jgi:hypothetical protein
MATGPHGQRRASRHAARARRDVPYRRQMVRCSHLAGGAAAHGDSRHAHRQRSRRRAAASHRSPSCPPAPDTSAPRGPCYADARADHVVHRQGEEERAEDSARLLLRERGAPGCGGRHTLCDLGSPADEGGVGKLLRLCHGLRLPAGASPDPPPRGVVGARAERWHARQAPRRITPASVCDCSRRLAPLPPLLRLVLSGHEVSGDGRAADRHPAPARAHNLDITSIYLQGIDNTEIIDTVHGHDRHAAVMFPPTESPATASLDAPRPLPAPSRVIHCAVA